MELDEIPTVTTKAGDKGMTSLGFGKKRPKSDLIFDLLGTLDELNSFIGIAVIHCSEKVKEQLISIQNFLFDMGGCISCDLPPKDYFNRFTNILEKWAVMMEASLPPLDSFILPGGTQSAAQLHVLRTVSRRCERIYTLYYAEVEDKEKLITEYSKILNRLSDYFFVCARYENYIKGTPDVKWDPNRNSNIFKD